MNKEMEGHTVPAAMRRLINNERRRGGVEKEYASGEELDILRFPITAEMRLKPLTSGDIFEASCCGS
jgi:hypothetical protein